MESNRCTFIASLGIVLIFTSVYSTATAPSNVALVIGSRTTLQCSTDIPPFFVSWSFTPSGSSEPAVTISGWDSNNTQCTQLSSHPQYQFNSTNTGQCDLIISNVAARDAGFYQCSGFQPTDGSFIYYAQVTVLYSDPICSQNVTANVAVTEVVSMKCTINYTSYGMNVFMTWYGCWYQTSSYSTVVNGNVTSTEHEIYTIVQSQQYLQTCSCNTTNGDPPAPPDGSQTASTVPYSKLWTSQDGILVQNCPDRPTLSAPTNSVLPLHTTVTCHGSGYPEPTEYSMNVRDPIGQISDIPHSSFRLSLVGQYEIVCQATSYLFSAGRGNFSCTISSTKYEYTVQNEVSTDAAVGIYHNWRHKWENWTLIFVYISVILLFCEARPLL